MERARNALDFVQNLLPNDLDLIAPSFETSMQQFPDLGRAGIRNVVNGIVHLRTRRQSAVRSVKGQKNFWVACEVMAGLSQGGGVGLAVANWMIEGDPGHEVWGDGRRVASASPMNTCPPRAPAAADAYIYDRLVAEDAVFGDYCGLENLLWFAQRAPSHAGTRRSTARRTSLCERGVSRRARPGRYD